MNKLEFQMDIPAVTREYTPGSCRNSRKHMRRSPPCQMSPVSLHCVQSNCVFPIKHVRNLDFLDWTPESPQEHCHNIIAFRSLLLLLSHFSRVRLCATPWMAAHQVPPSLGFSRHEHWSRLPFPSLMHESEKWKVNVKSLSRVRLLATPWTAAHQAPPSTGFSRQEDWSGVPLPSLLDHYRAVSKCHRNVSVLDTVKVWERSFLNMCFLR